MPDHSGNNRLLATLDDLRERMVRIEEGIKPIADIKKDVDTLKLTTSDIAASTKSAHKRLDDFGESMKELPKKYSTITDHKNHDDRIGKLEKNQHWVATLIIGVVILAVVGLVITN